jgi:hypothetical protein
MNFDDRKAKFFARTMHTPDDAARAELRAALRDLSRALLPLHRALIDSAKADYGLAYRAVETPGELLRLLQSDPFFDWLKPVTSLIVDIDEMARTDFAHEQVDAIAVRVDRLFGTAADSSFAGQYVPILQRDAGVAMGHAAVRKALTKLRRR